LSRPFQNRLIKICEKSKLILLVIFWPQKFLEAKFPSFCSMFRKCPKIILDGSCGVLTLMCKYHFLTTFFQNVLLKKKFFLLKKICQSYQCAMNESRKYSITLSKKMKNKKSIPLCVRGWTDFFSLHNGALKIAFSLFWKSKKCQ